MSVTESGNITAILKLETTEFNNSIEKANTLVGNFEKNLIKAGKNSAVMEMGTQSMTNALNALIPSLNDFNKLTSKVSNFNKFANGVNKIAMGLAELGKESVNAEQSINVMNNLMKQWQNTVTGTEVKVKGLKVSNLELANSANTAQNRYAAWNKTLANSRMSWVSADNALMTLGKNIQSFNNVVTGADGKVKQFNTTIDSSKSKINSYRIAFTESANSATQFATRLSGLNATLVNTSQRQANMGNALRNTTTSLNTSSSATSRLSTSYGVLDGKINSTIGKTQQLTTANNTLSNSKQRVSSSSSSASSSISRVGSSASTATGQVNKLSTTNSRLAKTMSSLRMMGSLVGSMLAYNFAHKLLLATGETIHAKSETEGYFKMLNLGQRNIDSFNQALDRTVQQFQRVNKYSLGETISSIGVEFNLSTKEMEKAMKVTSMVTSEYLRAGRSANEASLAVKDVLQGQFQRLSRETGVKGEQLKAAGWSGDTTDVLSLMEALEKVGESRHWDVFAEKANSLNDILTITQNRFGEWSADMVYSVQPAVVGAFNMIMGTAQKFATVISGVWEWLNTDSLESNIAKWSLLGTAITTVLGIITAYRTGAGLLQVAQMGLTRTIASTILGLNAEKVALYGTRAAIFAKIFGLEAEKVATLSTKDAILSKILGLDAELVAQTSLRQGILDKAFAQELETLRLSGATKEEMLNTLALYENQLAQKSSIGLLTAQALGLNMTTYATHGFTVALLEAKTGMAATELASMTLAKKIALLGVSVALPTAIVGAFAIALVALAIKMNDSAKAMEKFNDLVQSGDNIIKDAKSTVEEYTKRQESLKQKLSEAKEGTVEYFEAQNKLRDTNSLLVGANKELENSIKAVELAKSAQSHYEEKMTDMSIQHQNALAQAYMNAGYTAVEAYEMANDSLLDAQAGAEQLRITLQKIARLQYKGEQNVSYMLSAFGEAGVDKDTQKPYLEQAESLNSKMAKAMEKGMTDESFMGRMDGWLSYYQYQIENWINNVSAMVETGDWSKIWDNVWKGIAHGFADLPILKDFWGWVFDQTGISNLKGAGKNLPDPAKEIGIWIGESFANFGNSVMEFLSPLTEFDLIGTIMDLLLPKGVSASDGSDHPEVGDEMYQVIVQPIIDWWNGFMADPLSYIGNAMQYTSIGSLISALFGNDALDFSWAWEWLNNNVILPLQTQFNMFLADPLSYIGGVMTIGIGGLINALIPDDGGASILNYVNTSIIQPFTQGIQTGIASIPILGDIAQMLGLVPQQNQNAHSTGYNLIDHLKQGVEQKIREIPIIGDIAQMLGLIPSQNSNAHDKGHGIGQNIKDGEKAGHEGIAGNVSSEMSNVINTISNWAGKAYAAAHDIGSQILNGIKNALDMHSPSIISRELIANEFGKYIPESIMNAAQVAYQTAYDYGSRIKEGISAVNTDVGLGGMVQTYESDAQMVADSSQMMGMTTSTAFNDMQMSVNTSTSQMASNVNTQYTSMQQKQASLLNNMKTSNTSAYNEMYQKSNTSLLQMRSSTENVTHQMTNAWNTMKNNIVSSANKIKTDSTIHFNTLSTTIGSFYRKIQNPSSWGSAGSPKFTSGKRNTSAGKIFTSSIKHAAGGWTGKDTMTISALKRKLCPNGDCDGIFDNFKSNDVVNVSDFLSLMIPEGHGFGGWNFNNSHYNYIKNTSDKWGMKSPTINLKGGIATNANYQVGDFENGAPNISFSSFQSMAESIFSAIPYRFYYDSDWKGSWLGALQAGACNCWDGAHALVAFANSCGFSGGVQHGTWVDPDGTTYPHVYAVINGKKMDTTGWQQRRSWSAGSPNTTSRSSNSNSTHNTKKIYVTVDMSGATIYGVDDLETKIKDGVDKGLREHFNDPYTVSI